VQGRIVRKVFLLAVPFPSLFSISIPPQYATINIPLFDTRAAFYRLPADDGRQTIIYYNTAGGDRYTYSDIPDARFRKVDIHDSEKGQAHYEKLDGGGVPLLIINSTVIHGYNELKMYKALAE
jgi:hypothetical protein